MSWRWCRSEMYRHFFKDFLPLHFEVSVRSISNIKGLGDEVSYYVDRKATARRRRGCQRAHAYAAIFDHALRVVWAFRPRPRRWFGNQKSLTFTDSRRLSGRITAKP